MQGLTLVDSGSNGVTRKGKPPVCEAPQHAAAAGEEERTINPNADPNCAPLGLRRHESDGYSVQLRGHWIYPARAQTEKVAPRAAWPRHLSLKLLRQIILKVTGAGSLWRSRNRRMLLPSDLDTMIPRRVMMTSSPASTQSMQLAELGFRLKGADFLHQRERRRAVSAGVSPKRRRYATANRPGLVKP